MENATKALLIAAAVLIAILIISFSLIIYNMASETVGNVNLSEAEMTQFNAKFKSYEGNKVSGGQVNALLRSVIAHNQQEEKNGTKRYVTVQRVKSDGKLATLVRPADPQNNISATSELGATFSSSMNFKVTCTYTEGLITLITIDSNWLTKNKKYMKS